MTDGEMCVVGQNFSAIHYFHIMAAPGSRAWEFYLEWKGSPPLHSSSEAAANSEPVNSMTSKKKKTKKNRRHKLHPSENCDYYDCSH